MSNMRVGAFRYASAVLAVFLACVAAALIRPWAGPVSAVFFPAVIIPAIYGGYGPALLATLLSTVTLAYFFVPPAYSFDIGYDDFTRLAVFAVVALITASVSSARRRAEDALRGSLEDLQSVNATLRNVVDWPLLMGEDASEATREMLEHAARILGALEVLAIWEADEEPWIYVAAPSHVDVITRHRPVDLTGLVRETLEAYHYRHGDVAPGVQANPVLGVEFPGRGVAAVPFTTEHLTGRVFFAGMRDLTDKIVPAMDLVARQVSNSLDQLYLGEQIRGLAVQEDRIKLARDLHDGVLQSLTGIRLQLQEMADGQAAPLKQQLAGIERAIAGEQRELRLFIENVRPEMPASAESGDLAQRLEEMRRRLGIEWKTPISIRLTPPAPAVSPAIHRTLKLMIHEAVINALKHAHPSRISVDVQAADARQVRILVADDGHGFPFTGRLDHDALVLSDAAPRSLRDRVVALGGRMTVESGPSGACVEILLSSDL
jgi:signal transduction histidine kinase